MADRRAELERKRLKLAQIRAEKERIDREKQANSKDAASGGKNSRLWDLRAETDKLLESIGFSTTTERALESDAGSSSVTSLKTDSPSDNVSQVQREVDVPPAPKKAPKLSVVSLQETNIPPKESVTYNKQTQTAGTVGEREAHPLDYYVIHWDEVKNNDYRPLPLEWDDEFQVLTYDDIPVEEDGEGSSLTMMTPPYQNRPRLTSQHSSGSGLPVVEMVKPAQTSLEHKVEEVKPEKMKRELSEEEKNQLIMSDDFQRFFHKATKIVERALLQNEPPDIFIDYSGAKEEMENEDKSGATLSFNRFFFDDRWSKNRTVTCFDWSTQYPELLVASYNNYEDAPNDPDGVCLIWNLKFKKNTPEYVLHCQSPVMSTCFAKFHPNLIIGGTYSGQIVLWDNRSYKRTPVQRSPLSASAHTHPIYCVQVVGSPNAHNLITVSTDGKLCSWSLDMLSSPQDSMELSQQKQSRPVAVTSISFPAGDYNNFIIGSEEGSVYTACRHGIKAGILDVFEGHQGPVTNVDCHNVQSSVDFSHLFLTSSIDWTVKLWSTKENKPLHSFEDNCDYVYDARWSPIHPAVFATADGMGRVDLWNLNNDCELPTASVTIDNNPALNRITWTPSGHQLAVGDDTGKIWLYDVGEQLATPKGDEATRLMHNLQELKNNNVDAEIADIGSESAYSSLSSTALSLFSTQSLR